MASGLAVVAADAGGFRESICDGHDGLLVPPHAPSAYAAAIVRLCRDREFREALSRNARHSAEARDVTAENAELIEGYREVVGALGGDRAVATYA
jgi:glycosyltransferase involved in cell wall biosynthesis